MQFGHSFIVLGPSINSMNFCHVKGGSDQALLRVFFFLRQGNIRLIAVTATPR